MSKMAQLAFEMQEDAYEMTLQAFIRKYGPSNATVWHEVQQSIEDQADYYMEMDDGA
jgi:uncharacterized protein YozE (UPF0346 family)